MYIYFVCLFVSVDSPAKLMLIFLLWEQTSVFQSLQLFVYKQRLMFIWMRKPSKKNKARWAERVIDTETDAWQKRGNSQAPKFGVGNSHVGNKEGKKRGDYSQFIPNTLDVAEHLDGGGYKNT